MTLLLTTATLWFFARADRFEIQSENLIGAQSSWQTTGDVSISPDGTINLQNPQQPGRSALFNEIDMPPSRQILLAAKVTLRNVETGDQFWQLARIELEGRRAGEDSKWEWIRDAKLLAAAGTGSFVSERMVSIPHEFQQIRVVCDLTGATGFMSVHNLTARVVTERESTVTHRQGLALVWAVIAVIAIATLWRNQFRFELVAIVAAGVVLFLTPAWARTWIYPMDQLLRFSLEHTMLFFLLSGLLLYRLGARAHAGTNPGILIGYLICIAVASETAQLFTPTRGPSIIDCLSNLGGIGAAYLLWWGTITPAFSKAPD